MGSYLRGDPRNVRSLVAHLARWFRHHSGAPPAHASVQRPPCRVSFYGPAQDERHAARDGDRQRTDAGAR